MAYTEYLQDLKDKKTIVKLFIDNKTMLEGKITSFDNTCVIIDKCMVLQPHIISIVPR